MIYKMYFGHPINVYGTELEKRLLEIIDAYLILPAWRLDRWVIENPNQPCHSQGYKDWAERTGKGMDYYYNRVLPGCAGGIFLPFRDGKWGTGVFAEAKNIWLTKCRPIWEITHEGKIRKLDCLRGIQVLSVEETRKRIRDANGQPLPY